MTKACDCCDSDIYTVDRPRVFACLRRPSDPREMCAVLAGHADCLNAGELSCGPEGGCNTAAQWEKWIESDAARNAGVLFLSLGS